MNHPSPELLSGLLDKYRSLHRLRTEPTELAPRAELRRLARQWPGSLRELDRLPLEVIEARLLALEAVVAQARDVERWMALQVSYHGFMRATLRVKRWSRDWPEDVEASQRALGQRYVAAADEPGLAFFDAAMVAAIRRPVGGRLNPLVLAAVARVHGVGAEEVIGALLGGSGTGSDTG